MAPPAAPAEDGADFPADAVEVGRVAGAFGVKGWIRVVPHARNPQALFASRRWYLRAAERPGIGGTLPELLRVTQCRPQGEDVVAQAEELLDRSAAEALQGARVHVSRASFPTTAEGEYYWIDLIGLAVVNRHGEALGTVSDLFDTGAHCVLRLRSPDAGPDAEAGRAERLIPFVDAYIDRVDLDARQIVADWGLDY